MIKHPRRPFLTRRPNKPAADVPTPVGPLALSAATYSASESVTLTFNQAVDVDGLQGNQITVDDGGGTGFIWIGTDEVTVVNPTTVTIGLDQLESSISSGTTLNANPENGIVAVDDGEAWEGASGVSLPFGE